MACTALEEKINKIRQQNEEIRRRYEEVEEDKKNAAKLNALVQMVPSSDWPERKEPPEFSDPPRPKQRMQKEKHEYGAQAHIGDVKKGNGPPPDPKYNFLADSEREEGSLDYMRDNMGNRTQNKVGRGTFRRRGSGRDMIYKDNRSYRGNYREEHQPGYEAWRAERNRIDEDRISRQRTAEGNWRREWDNDKMHIVDDMKNGCRPTLGDFTKKTHKDFDRRYHVNGGDYQNHNRGGHRPYRGVSKNFHGGFENRSHNTYDQHKHHTIGKMPLSPDDRTVVATDKSIKVTLNQNSAVKGSLMGVKVNLPTIAGTGRVGPRQRARTTYSLSDAEIPLETECLTRQKSFEDKTKNNYFNNQKITNLKRSQSQKKKNETTSKSPYLQRKYHDNEFRCLNPQKTYNTKSTTPNAPNEYPTSEHLDNKLLHETDYDQTSSNMIENLDSGKDNSHGVLIETDKNDHDQTILSENSDLKGNETDSTACNMELKDDSIDAIRSTATENNLEMEIKNPETATISECIAKDDNNENENFDENPKNLSTDEPNLTVVESQNTLVACDKTNENLNKPENHEETNQSEELSKGTTEYVESSCDNNKDAVVNGTEDINAPTDNSVCSSQAEMCTVIEKQGVTELLQSTEESSESSNESLAANSPKSIADNSTEESVDSTLKKTTENNESNSLSKEETPEKSAIEIENGQEHPLTQ